ncbi:MAG TPA: CHAD domain-containing protein [Bradyrhizobium sp.]|uniref:CYTH and CHAD domain-containing protein n=1 Tax=Bradyrhizobium sp. TaxID=376 RepID=UPI002D7F504E|nr:CHAD domain-containing protein [Bradyrhizobium sp.]HET7888402.1 CHAD domain-containing protein [Bradyrhizobium sp.]
MSIESELKFRLARGDVGALSHLRVVGAQIGPVSRRRLVSTYFDTPKRKLHRHGLALRVRQSGEQFQQTIKTAPGGGFARGEWETELHGAKPDFRKAKGTPLANLANRKTRRKIRPVFQTTVERQTRPLSLGASAIELAVDRGKISSGRHAEAISEFELELKKGQVPDLFRLARTIERRLGAELDLSSKAEHGYRLANGGEQPAIHAEPVELSGKMTARDAFKVIGYASLRHFSANAAGVRALDAEAVHQMRVGLRRLRAAISLFGELLPGPRTADIKHELKWLTGELAPAREIDVFLAERIKPLGRSSTPKRGFRALEKHFAAQRKTAFHKARAALATARYRRLLIDVLEWLALRGAGAPAAETPIGDFAAALMQRRTRKVRKQGRHLNELSPRQRHKLRIKVKKLRYAVDFFEALYPAKADEELARFSGRLKKIQDALGALNDFLAHRTMAADAALTAPRKDRRARAFASGLLAGHEEEASKTLLKSASRELRRLRQLEARPS